VRPEPLNERNWKLYAAKHYSNPQSWGDEEFEQDVKRLKYIKKALTRYRTTGDLGERLIINHLIVLCNVFGPTALVRLIFLKMEDHLPCIKPFLVLLSIMPDVVYSVGREPRDWRSDEIAMDPTIVNILRGV
jgi:hypothetical protein